MPRLGRSAGDASIGPATERRVEAEHAPVLAALVGAVEEHAHAEGDDLVERLRALRSEEAAR
jgi:hypothetical protein